MPTLQTTCGGEARGRARRSCVRGGRERKDHDWAVEGRGGESAEQVGEATELSELPGQRSGCSLHCESNCT
eukprot:1421304-Rhodomonas_salina.1